MLLPISYTGISEHTRMLNDNVRTCSFIQGIQEVVKPGDVVVDIGTGTGILAIAAAKAGAKKVYAIEASSMGKIAHAHFEANGLAHKISLIPGWSQNITLPEKADVMISETIGHDPLSENILEITTHASEQLLKPNAILIPSKMRIFGLPLTIPSEILQANTPTIENLRNWAESYNVDFTIFGISASQTPHHFRINPSMAREWQPISEPVLIMELSFGAGGVASSSSHEGDDLDAIAPRKEQNNTTVDIAQKGIANISGIINGILVFFELEVSPSQMITTHPNNAESGCSWKSPVWTLPETFELEEGEPYQIRYSRGPNHSEIRFARGAI